MPEKPGKEAPAGAGRRRRIALFERMRAEFADGEKTLRAKIDMYLAESAPARPGDLSHPPEEHHNR